MMWSHPSFWFAPDQEKVEERNNDYNKIVNELTFKSPFEVHLKDKEGEKRVGRKIEGRREREEERGRILWGSQIMYILYCLSCTACYTDSHASECTYCTACCVR
jgi:hypothetical protein